MKRTIRALFVLAAILGGVILVASYVMTVKW